MNLLRVKGLCFHHLKIMNLCKTLHYMPTHHIQGVSLSLPSYNIYLLHACLLYGFIYFLSTLTLKLLKIYILYELLIYLLKMISLNCKQHEPLDKTFYILI